MINYKNLQEVSSSEKHHVLAFGRMNPITSGHEAVVNKLHSVAKENNASHSLIVSHSQDAKKNPLNSAQKVKHAKNAFPGTNVSSASKEAPTILHHAAAAHAAGATHLHVIAGSDRHEDMHNLLNKYNDKDSGHGHYNFKKITVHSSGERDPDSTGTTGISASKMREHAASGNKVEFHKGAPSKMTPQHKDAMYNDVRKGMNIKEELRPEMGAGVYINDFMRSTNPKFNNKTPQERRMMAMGAYMAAKARGVKEEIQIDELSTDLLSKYKKSAGDQATAADKVGDFKTGNKRFSGIIKATKKQFSNELKTPVQVKEDNKHYEEAEEHLSKANAADAKGDKLGFHYHMADHHDSLSQWHESKGRSASADKHADKADYHSEKYTQQAHGVSEGTRQGNSTACDTTNTTSSAPSKDTTMSKKIKGFKFFSGENETQTNKPVKENSNKDTMPFDGPYKSNFKKPNNPNRTGMDAARSLAQRAMDQISKKKPVNGTPTNVKEEILDEKSEQARKNKIMKNVMDASRGAKYNRHSGLKLTPGETGHSTAQQMNKALGRNLRNEATVQKSVNVDKVNTAGQEPHEEKFETIKKPAKLKKEETMKSYKEFLQTLDEKLVGKQKKLDKNHNDTIDAEDFKLLKKEEVEQIDEYESDSSGVYRNTKKATYGTSYKDPAGADETSTDMKKAEKKFAGRKAGQSTGSYKPRKTMSKLKQAAATYK